MYRCHQCGKELDIKKELGRKEACPFCRYDLRCCLNCTYHDPASYNACRESQAERVLEKERSNFCEYFIFKKTANSQDVKGTKNQAIDKLNDLFKK